MKPIMNLVAAAILLLAASFAHTVNAQTTTPTRTPRAEDGQQMPERDAALNRLKFAWTPFALAVAKGEMPLVRLRSSILRLADPVEEFGSVKLEFVNEEFLTRGVGLLVQISNTGQIFNWEWVDFPFGVNQHRRVGLPLLDPGSGSGRIVFMYFPEGQPAAGQLGIVGNYPLGGAQPENPAVKVVKRTLLTAEAGNYGQPGYEFEMEADGGLVSVFLDGRQVGIVASQLPVEGSRKQVFLLPTTAFYGIHGAAPGRTVEITFCTGGGQCTSETLTPRVQANPAPMDQ